MMNTTRSLTENEQGTDRLALKLFGIFALSFIIFALIFVAWDVFSLIGREGVADQPIDDQATRLEIDPKIEADLAKVLAEDVAPETGEIIDAFADRGGLSSKSAAAQATTVGTGSTGSGSGAPGSTASTGTGAPTKPGASTTATAAPQMTAAAATKARYEAWLERAAIDGEMPLDPRVFAIEDLLPVGIVDGGDGQQEVMFYSEAAGKTLSFPLGTLFFDGWLTELRPEGVVFSSIDDRRKIRTRSWARSIRNAE